MLQRLRGAWAKWRERSRQNAIEAGLYKARGGGAPHDFSTGVNLAQAGHPVDPVKTEVSPPTGPP